MRAPITRRRGLLEVLIEIAPKGRRLTRLYLHSLPGVFRALLSRACYARRVAALIIYCLLCTHFHLDDGISDGCRAHKKLPLPFPSRFQPKWPFIYSIFFSVGKRKMFQRVEIRLFASQLACHDYATKSVCALPLTRRRRRLPATTRSL